MDTDGNVIQGTFHALGHAGSDSYAGLEIIKLEERMASIVFYSDEFTAVCPVTGQPDLYEIEITLENTERSIESKSLKLYLARFRNKGCFCENLAVKIKQDIFSAVRAFGDDHGGEFMQSWQLTVSITQKARGGISIVATT